MITNIGFVAEDPILAQTFVHVGDALASHKDIVCYYYTGGAANDQIGSRLHTICIGASEKGITPRTEESWQNTFGSIFHQSLIIGVPKVVRTELDIVKALRPCGMKLLLVLADDADAQIETGLVSRYFRCHEWREVVNAILKQSQ